jgi:hypothetical protein
MAIVADSFEGSALRTPWTLGSYRQDLLVVDPPTVSGGYVDLELDVGGASGSHWFDARIGQLLGQLVTGDFDIAVDLQVFDQAGAGLPPATGGARLGVLAAHDPDRATTLNYVHRGIGRAPGASAPGDGIVDEDKTTVASVSTWDTRAAPDVVTCRAWIRMRRVGDVFSTWTGTDGVTWGNQVDFTRADLPAELEVGVAAYATDADADLRVRVYSAANLPVVSTTALPVVVLEVDGVTDVDEVAARIGPASDTLTAGAEYLVFARGNARSATGGIDTTLDLRVGGTVLGRMAGIGPFSAPAYGATDSPHLALFALVTAGASDEMEFFASDSLGDSSGLADVCRAYAVDVTELTEDAQRWHEQTANSDTIVTTPTSGWTTVGSPLVVTVPRTGNYVLLVSGEYVADGTEADTDQAHVRVTQNSTEIPGSIKHAGLGFGGFPQLDVGNYARPFLRALTSGVEYTFALQANGTSANGNLGWRRVRLHLLEAAAFEDGDVVQGEDTAGVTVAAGAEADADADVELAPPGLASYLVLTAAQGQFSAWPRTFVVANGVEYPTGVDAANGTGTGTAADMTVSLGLQLLADVAGVTAGFRVEAAAGGTQGLWGADAERTDDGTGGGAAEGGPIHVLAIRLAVEPDTVSAAATFGPAIDLAAAADAVASASWSAGLGVGLATAATVTVAAAIAAGPGITLRIAGGLPAVLLDPESLEAPMSDVLTAIRTGGAAPGATATRINTTTNAAITQTPAAGKGAAVVAGFVSADEDVVVEFWDGVPEADGATMLCDHTLVAGVVLPLSVLALYSAGGRPVYVRAATSVQLRGRSIALEV